MSRLFNVMLGLAALAAWALTTKPGGMRRLPHPAEATHERE